MGETKGNSRLTIEVSMEDGGAQCVLVSPDRKLVSFYPGRKCNTESGKIDAALFFLRQVKRKGI